MDKILHGPKDPKLWELWYIPYYGSCRILSISRINTQLNMDLKVLPNNTFVISLHVTRNQQAKSPALGYTQVEALLVLLTACTNFKFRPQQPRDSQLLVLGAVEGRKHSKTVPKPRPSLGRDRLPRPGALERIQHRAWTAPQHSFGHTHTRTETCSNT